MEGTLTFINRPRSFLFTDRGRPQVPGKVPRLLEQARQWLLEHRAEVEEHPDIVYSSGISQDGSYAPATKMPTTIKKLSIADT